MAVTPIKRLTRVRNKPTKYDFERSIESDDENIPDINDLNLDSVNSDVSIDVPVSQPTSKGRRSKTKKPIQSDVLSEQPDFMLVDISPAKRTRTSKKTGKTPLSNVLNMENRELDFEFENSPLYDVLIAKNCGINSLCNAWLLDLQNNYQSAIHQLISLGFNFSGCKFLTLSSYINFNDESSWEIFESIEQQYSSNSNLSFPNRFDSKDKDSKKSLMNYKNFWTALVELSFASVIGEESFIPEVIFWVSRMTTSEYRTMRLSSTVALLGLVSGFCTLINKYQNELETTERIKNSAAKKKRPRRTQTDNESISKAMEFCMEQTENILNAAFVNRLKDIDYRIRTECILFLGQWCELLPSKFVTGTYLRYFSNHLLDPKPHLRETTILEIAKLAKEPDAHLALRPFIERTKKSLFDSALYDANESVRIAAINLIVVLLEVNLLSCKVLDENLKLLIFHTNSKIRHSAASLVKIYLQNMESFNLLGFCTFLLSNARPNSADVMFELYCDNSANFFSISSILDALFDDNRKEEYVEVLLRFLLSAFISNLRTTGKLEISADQIVLLIQKNKEYLSLVFELLEKIPTAIFLENSNLFNSAIFNVICDSVIGISDIKVIQSGIKLLSSFKENDLLHFEVGTQIEDFYQQILSTANGLIQELSTSLDINENTLHLLERCLFRIENVLSFQYLNVNFLFPFVEKCFVDGSRVEIFQDIFISSLNCLFKYVVQTSKEYEVHTTSELDRFIDVCTLGINSSLQKVNITCCILLVDFFVFFNVSDSQLIHRIASILKVAIEMHQSLEKSVEMQKIITCFCKMVIFQLVPPESNFFHILAAPIPDDILSVLLNCVIDKLVEKNGDDFIFPSNTFLDEILIGLCELIQKDGDFALRKSSIFASILSRHFVSKVNFSLKSAYLKVYNLASRVGFSLFDILNDFIKFLTKQESIELIVDLNSLFPNKKDFPSKRDLGHFESHIKLLTARSKIRRERLHPSASNHLSKDSEVHSHIETDYLLQDSALSELNESRPLSKSFDEADKILEQNDENPFASSPNFQ